MPLLSHLPTSYAFHRSAKLVVCLHFQSLSSFMCQTRLYGRMKRQMSGNRDCSERSFASLSLRRLFPAKKEWQTGQERALNLHTSHCQQRWRPEEETTEMTTVKNRLLKEKEGRGQGKSMRTNRLGRSTQRKGRRQDRAEEVI